MHSREQYKKILDRLSEVKIYIDQGLEEGIDEIFYEILAAIEEGQLSADEKEELLLRVKEESGGRFGGLNGLKASVDPQSQNVCECEPEPRFDPPEAQSSDPSQHFDYGLALMDGQFWEEAIAEFNAAAELGHEPLKSREYSGDCAARLEKWVEAIRYYNIIYSDPEIPEELRKQILLKINKCSQTQKKSSFAPAARSAAPPDAVPEVSEPAPEVVTSSISSLDGYSVDSVLGSTISSWIPPGEEGRERHEYRIMNLLHVGSSSLIVELEQLGSGAKFAGQTLTGNFGEVLSPEKLAEWVRENACYHSQYLVKIHDLAHSDDHFFIVRDHYPLSLCDVLAAGEYMPISLAVRFAHQVLEALGDLHLHMSMDEQPVNSYHLDLRPSRVLLRTDLPCCKISNGGLWRRLESAAPDVTSVANIPIHCLPYRAPEQFRTYLARKKPPIFTDIYLFGALFYEMLTGVQAFKASSREEYELQHCEQYPSPPRVWRAEIPETINEMIMTCLESNPIKRYRSTTQMSLLIEKAYPDALARPKDDSYQVFLQRLKLI